MCGGMVLWCTRVLVCVFFLSFSLSNSFFCALWCSIQVIVHVHVCVGNIHVAQLHGKCTYMYLELYMYIHIVS